MVDQFIKGLKELGSGKPCIFSFSWKVHVSQVKGRITTQAGSKAREVLAEVTLPGMDTRHMEGTMKGENIKKPEILWC